MARPSSSGPAGAVAVPERHLPRLPGRRGDDHLLEGDVLDAPGGRAEQEGLARAALVDHLLVELAHAGAVGERDGEEPAVGDGAGVGDGEALRTGAAAHDALDAVPHDARPQLGELLGRVAARRAGRAPTPAPRRRARRTAPRSAPRRRGRRASTRRARTSPRSAGRARRAGCAGSASPRSGPACIRSTTTAASSRSARCLGNSFPRLGAPTWWPARPTRCRPRGDRAGRLHLDDEVDGAHVDAELEAGRGDQALEPAGLELVLDLQPPLARQRAVVGLHQLLVHGRGALGLGRRGSRPPSAAR